MIVAVSVQKIGRFEVEKKIIELQIVSLHASTVWWRYLFCKRIISPSYIAIFAEMVTVSSEFFSESILCDLE